MASAGMTPRRLTLDTGEEKTRETKLARKRTRSKYRKECERKDEDEDEEAEAVVLLGDEEMINGLLKDEAITGERKNEEKKTKIKENRGRTAEKKCTQRKGKEK